MLSEKMIREELWEIGKTFPTLGGLLQKPVGRSKTTVGSHWVEVIKEADLNADHIENVCTEYSRCEREMPDRQDQLVFEIIQECKDRRAKDVEKLNQQVYHQKTPKVDSGVAERHCWARHYVIANGPFGDKTIQELIDWTENGGSVPSWCEPFRSERKAIENSEEYKKVRRTKGTLGLQWRSQLVDAGVDRVKLNLTLIED